jgi:hypothetical protein
MRKIISLICFLLPFMANADVVQIRPDAPDRHIVVKGDTLWDISTMFYKDPWKWPSIWNINKESIKDPHWIYPGDVINLNRNTGLLSINGDGTLDQSDTNSEKLSPRVRSDLSQHEAIASIPFKDIKAFLAQPLVVEEESLASAPKLVALQEGRVILGDNQVGYVNALPVDQGNKWQAYRPGKTFTDPESGEVLGREAVYLGDVEVTQFGEVSSVLATKTKLEINIGDRLARSIPDSADNFLPRPPSKELDATIISIYGGVSQAGQNTVVTLNKGARDGMESGNVLALFSKGKIVKQDGDKYTLPDERYGLIFVFRVFNKVSYGLVMQTKLPAQISDHARNP